MVVGKLAPFCTETDDFEAWVEVVNSFFVANEIDKVKTPERAVGIFISSIGLPTYTLLKSLVAPADPSTKKLDDLVEALKSHFKPAPKALAERHKFYSRKQSHSESVNVYLSELRKLAMTCKFENLNISLRDQFIFGLISESAQKRIFLEDDNISLDKVVAIAFSQQQAETSTLVVRSGPTTSVPVQEVVNKIYSGKKKENRNQSTSSQSSSRSCPNCGRSHEKKDCPHKNVECHTCNKRGHFAKFCRSGGGGGGSPKGQSSKTVRGVKSVRQSKPPIMLSVQINGCDLQVELDTGSDATFVSKEVWKQLGSPKLLKSSSFSTFTDQLFQSNGNFSGNVFHYGQSRKMTVEVNNKYSILGRDFLAMFQVDWTSVKSQCGQVNQVKASSSFSKDLQCVLDEYSDVFDKSVERIANFKARLVLKEDATPKFSKARPVPFAIRPKVDAELIKMEEKGFITRIEHSEWASPLVVVPKSNGSVRITGDFKRTVNPQLCVNQYPLARVEDIFESISGGEHFSKLDATDAYHQVEVEESSRKFLVINTHRGLFRYNVLPQGISSSPAIFQELMDKMLQGISMTGGYIDDVITSGRDQKEHLHHLKQILQRMRDFNFRLSRDKSEFVKTSVPFLGHVLCRDGIRTNPKNVEAIKTMPKPKNVSEVQSFLGLVNFYAKFVPNLSSVCEPLYSLTRDGAKFQWTSDCEKAMESVKNSVTSAPVLAHFQQSLPIGITCDASSVGLGVVLFHQYSDGSERPIAFASKTLSKSERNYSQIEKEGLAIVFGVKRFIQFLFGRRFILVTDHEPLIKIFGEKTNLPPLAATRLHRWSLFLSGFSFDISYRNTKQHGNADALSRLPLPVSITTDESSEVIVKRLTEENPVTSKSIKFRTSRDPVLAKVFRFIQTGWPSKQSQVEEVIRPYFPHRHEYTIEDGTILWGIRVVVPLSLQPQVLQQLHDTHPGIVRMKALARNFVWWPGVDEDIERTVKSCVSCSVHQDNPTAAKIHPWSFPERPWQRLHVDLAGPFLGNMWLIIVDAHSKWPEVFKLGHDSTSTSVINRIRETISRFGVPDTIVSDNGPQFVSDEFEQFCVKNGIRHTTSSAYHPRSNGEAERFIRTFKNAIKKEKGDNISLCSFLLTYRVTPHATIGVSPAELLLKCKPKTLLDLVKPNPSAHVRQRQELMVEGGTSSVREFQPGGQVWVQSQSKNAPKWSLGTIVRAVGPLSYVVQVEDRQMKRHVDHIISAVVKPFPSSQISSSPTSPGPSASPARSIPATPAVSPEFRSVPGSPVLAGAPPPVAPIPLHLPVDESVNTSATRSSSRQRKEPQRFVSYHEF